MHRRLGCLQSRFPFPLYLPLAEDQAGLPFGQSRVGVPEIRTLEWRKHATLGSGPTPLSPDENPNMNPQYK
jgi:hypothetical protein